MKRALWLLTSTLLLACEGSPIEIFAPAAGAGGDGGTAGSSSSDTAGVGGDNSAGAGVGGGDSGAGTDAGGGGSSGGMPTAGAAGSAGTSCATNVDCTAGWFCKKATCADAMGVCELLPKFCQTDLMPVCACDHLTYWNECYRRAAGQSASSSNDCTEGAHLCMSNTDCPDGAYCSRLLPEHSACSQMFGPGSCWVTPDSCSEVTEDLRRWKPCGMGAPDAGTCLSTCDAVQSGRVYVAQPQNVPCQ